MTNHKDARDALAGMANAKIGDSGCSSWTAFASHVSDAPVCISVFQETMQSIADLVEAQDAQIAALRMDAERYQWLRNRDVNTIASGGVFAGMTPENVILTGDDMDTAIDAAIRAMGDDND